ncbi:granulocyte colony-stimulating factor receptor isoform 1-T3 [Pholidichthys leucotaenia]
MTSTWASVIVLLLTFVNCTRNEEEIQPCAKMQTSSSVVPLGSPVTATCVIREDCPLITGRDDRIEWRLGDSVISTSPGANESSRVSRAVISSFNHTRAILTCSIQASVNQVVAGVEIRAGYLPEIPQNLSCQTNLTSPLTMTCSWDPGQETHLFTKYTLHTKIWDSNENHTYKPPPGVHHYTIPRSDFVLFSNMNVFIKAGNDLGEVTSVPITLEPISSAKFDPPKILAIEVVQRRYGCLRLRWSISQHQHWFKMNHLNLEVQLKTADSSRWNEPIFVSRVPPSKPVHQCHLLHGTQYFAQIRVRYKQSPWSEWSSSQSGATLETAPTGRLDTWMKISGDNVPKQLNIVLFWKPSKQFRANGQNVSYVISLQKLSGERGKVCSTRENYCAFQLPGRAKKVYLRAVNAAGKSSPTEVRIYQPKARTAVIDVAAVPQDDNSILVQWRTVAIPSLTGYVVEWRPLLRTDFSHIQFQIVDRNQSSFLITGSFEPYKPYGISVYPRFKDGMGLPQTVNAYLRQKAPSMVPKIYIKKTWNYYIELTWDEIPLADRNGIIQNYKIFYWEENGQVSAVNADPEKRKVVLKDLNTTCLYGAFLMVSTFGGSQNGSTIHFRMEPLDDISTVIIATFSGLGLALVIICIVQACLSKPKRLKRHFCPVVPDPANSSIKRWSSESMQYPYPVCDREEPNPVYLSHLSFLDLPTKLDKEEDNLWLNSKEDTSDLGESICGSPFIPGYSGSNSNSVPYATVIFSGPCNSPPSPKEPHVYLRSESTQPLLETEESFSPKCYHNMAADGMTREQWFFGPSHDCITEEEEDPVIIWDDFPFLQALAMNNNQND